MPNKVLKDTYLPSLNFYESDTILRHYLEKNSNSNSYSYIKGKLSAIGKEAAGRMNQLSMLADKNGPELVKRDAFGETINEIRFHPAYWELMKIAVDSEMMRVKMGT